RGAVARRPQRRDEGQRRAADRDAAGGVRAAREPARRAVHGLSQRARSRGHRRPRRPRAPRGAGLRAHRRREAAAFRRAGERRDPPRGDVARERSGGRERDSRARRRRRVRRTRLARRRRHGGRHAAARALVGAGGARRQRVRARAARARARLSARRGGRVIRLASAGGPFDRALLLVLPAALFMLLLFVYPFVYGLVLSFEPAQGGALANYHKFFTTGNLWPTIWTTLRLAL